MAAEADKVHQQLRKAAAALLCSQSPQKNEMYCNKMGKISVLQMGGQKVAKNGLKLGCEGGGQLWCLTVVTMVSRSSSMLRMSASSMFLL